MSYDNMPELRLKIGAEKPTRMPSRNTAFWHTEEKILYIADQDSLEPKSANNTNVSAYTSDPPTGAELDSVFGLTASQVGSGFVGTIDNGTYSYFIYSDGSNWWIQRLSEVDTPAPTSDELIKISSADTTGGYLEEKLIAGSGITLTKLNTGGNEQIRVSSAAGTANDEDVIVNFDFSDTSPLLMYTFTADGVVTWTKIVIEDAFNGTATLSIGITGQTGLLIRTSEVDPYVEGSYITSPDVDLGNTTNVYLYMTKSGVTQGSGKAILSISR